MTQQQLRDRVFLITGAAQGIGRAIARLFAYEGAQLALLDRNAGGLRQIASETASLALECDLCEPDSIARVVEFAVARFGRLDGLINAAGVHAAGSVGQTDIGQWRAVMAVNLDAPFLVCRAAEPHLRRSKGATIVNISSGTGLQPFANRSAYATSKGGLITLGKVLAMEFAPDIRVNTICPGLIDTPMAAALPYHNDLGAITQRYALKRIGQPEEVAQAALYLSSPASSYITGVTLAVDGGRTYH
ncbi:SDR family NAD(P)-dependent oxidoreductase [Pontitalea aquivivens]|uniref:SDR family NAD(P)-dependent oxidoreductase n=1 Tax=Pontitalea aquivivens TaxID=3388663 RepID=UPI00397108B2